MENKKTIKCQAHGVPMPVTNCITRQKIVSEKPTDGLKATAYKLYKETCGKCQVGLELYRLEKLKAEASTMEKPVPVTHDAVWG